MSFLEKIKLSHGKEGGIIEMVSLALPMVISTACDGIMTFTDRLFLSALSPLHMNAALAGGLVVQSLVFFFFGLIGYSTALAAQYYGSGRREFSSVTATQSALIAFLACPVILLAFPVVEKFVYMSDIEPSQLNLQIIYMNILIFGALPGLLRHTLSCFFSGTGRTGIVMVASILAMLVNVGLDYIFIFGKFGFPPLGIKGAAFATICGSLSSFLFLLFVYLLPDNRKSFSVFKSFKFNLEVMKKLLYFGYPAGLEMFLNFLAFNMMVFLFHSQGGVVATASSIMFSWDLISFIPLLGIEIAVTSLVGRYIGAGKVDIAHRSAMSGIKTGLWFSFIVLIAFLFFSEDLVMVFAPQQRNDLFIEATPMAASMIKIASIYVLAEAMMVSLLGALRGAGDTHWTMVASVAFNWLAVLFLYIIFNILSMSAIAAWASLVLSFMIFCFFLFLRYRSGKWKEIKVL
ncbi:MAG TPA: MATE family efflux transporter [Spirochaetota bacterium]|jgi:MATE family multidrug resistance protein|nr:MATE family efflux transporter [Spirochaetota bacterium]HPD76822.1 MATE family efflux transporter [Spirochaetota bacterium]HRS61679.1 MATE family efflux transporter [Spirochaetota bacterium]HRU64266.1 MATE family efflux transporter [Spirochaetota bacterium]